jgi:hypothetical protein
MKLRLITLTLLGFFSISAWAQENALSEKEAELKKAQAELAAVQAKIDALKADIVSLKPVVKWKKGGFGAVNFNAVGLNNWAAGGVQAISVTGLGNLFANYKFENLTWENNLDVAYGVVKNQNEDLRKNEDKIDLLSKVGSRATDKLNYAALVNFKSQFAEGFDFNSENEDRPVISRFLAPAFILASAGMDYKVNEHLAVYLSPATGKFTIVNDPAIANQNIYIPLVLDANGNPFYSNSFRSEFGALMNIFYQQDLTKKINLRSKLDLFNNFTDINRANRKNIDVNWETNLGMKISEYIGVSLFTHFIYDNDIDIALDFDTDGNPTRFGPRLQQKVVFGLGASYKF